MMINAMSVSTMVLLACLVYATDPIDTRGPVIIPGMKIAVDHGSVQAIDYNFTTHIKPDPWRAQWIIPGSTLDISLLRKKVMLNSKPYRAIAYITATSKYRMYINGRLATRGPPDWGHDIVFPGVSRHLFYERFDLTAFFQSGDNVIAVEVFGTLDHWDPHRETKFLFEADIDSVIVVSDTSWKAQAKDMKWFTDARIDPIGWQYLEFDDSMWSSSTTTQVTDTIVPSDIPPLMEVSYPYFTIASATDGIFVPLNPFHHDPIIVTRDGSFLVTFDRVFAAYYGFKITGVAGTKIDLFALETHNGTANHQTSVILRDGVQYFESYIFAAVGTIKVVLTNVTKEIKVHDISATFTSMPVQYRGSFECNDDQLNRIWNVSRWATQICLQTWHLDSPHHNEPVADYGDYLIEDSTTNYAFQQPRLIRQDIRKYGWIMVDSKFESYYTSYRLIWLQCLLQYYDHYGDKDFIIEMAPTAHGLIDHFQTYIGQNGIISEAPDYMFMDWVNIGPFSGFNPPAVIGQGFLTAWYYNALNDGIRICQVTQDTTRLQKYQILRKSIYDAFQKELWVPEKGLYRDGKPFQTHVKPSKYLPADKNVTTFSPHVNALAVLYELAPKDKYSSIMTSLLSSITSWEVLRPYFMHFVFGAMYKANLFNKYATQWMRKWYIHPETQTFYEMGDGGDLSHGWITTPLTQLSGGVLGVSQDIPGYGIVSIRPHICDLMWAKGVVPTPQGNVAVSWDRTTNFVLTIKTPAVAKIAIPSASPGNAVITVNDKLMWDHGRAIPVANITNVHAGVGTVEAQILAGDYVFIVKPSK